MKYYHTHNDDQAPHGASPGPDQPEPIVRCFVCHRQLRDPESVDRGCGRTCAERVGLLESSKSPAPESNITPLFPLPERSHARRVTIHVSRYHQQRRVTCQICSRKKPKEDIHPVSLGEDPAVIAVCEPCIAAIVRYGVQPVRDLLGPRTRREVS